ncbi:hypothetical protein ACFV83_07070 [Streptomyces pharetrae]|uniref:hypothetical protein n=1 Tax=Streptomyces pharetrae TaxID=291370 RepID=UPI003660A6F6
MEPQPHLDGTLELARPGAQPFRTYQVSTGPVGHDWVIRLPAGTFGPGDYQWRMRAESAEGPSAWSAWCSFTVTGPVITPAEAPDPHLQRHGRPAAAAVHQPTPSVFGNPASGKCLDVPDGDVTNGSRLRIHECDGTDAKIWKRLTPG